MQYVGIRGGVRTLAVISGMVLAGIAGERTAAAQVPAPPSTPRVDHVDRYHGEAVRDPYRWLERIDSAAVREWARAQDTRTRAALADVPGRDHFRRRIAAHTATTDYSVPAEAGGRLFYLVLEPGASHNVVAGRWGGEERILFDPAAHISQLAPSPSGDRVLVTVTPEGAGVSWTALVAADGSEVAPRLSDSRVPPSPWTADGRGFFYFRQDGEGGEALMLRHPSRAEDLRIDPSAIGAEPGARITAAVTADHRWLVTTVRTRDGERVTAFSLGRDGHPSSPTRLVEGPGRHELAGMADGAFLFRTTEGAPRGRVVRVRRDGAREDVVPETDAILDDAFVFGGRVVAYYLRDAKPEVAVYGLDGARERTVALPFGLVFTDYLQGWPGFSGSPEGPHVYFRSLNMTAPGVYRLDLRTGAVAPFLLRGVDVDPDAFVMRHVTYRSADGTEVPMFVAHRKDVALDGTAPALMWAYGAYGWTPVPFFNAKYLTFLEAGGVFAIPYARGGGVRGAAWHRAGVRARKQNTIDDVIAGAEWLVEHGYTSPDRLGLEGQGPAGAAVGGAVTQRPGLFAAVIFDVAVTDMLRREAVGNPMVGQLGTVADSAEYAALRAYSPYHRALQGGGHPAALLKTGDRDQVVPTMHAYKMTAALQAAPAAQGPALLRVDWTTGHGFGKTQQDRHAEWVDDLSFLSLTLEDGDTLSGRAACPGPRLTHLANMGVLVEGDDGSVLIDAPFTEPVEPFPGLPEAVRTGIEDAAAPFDGVRWVLITHAHRDHVDPVSVARHLASNPSALLASTDSVVAAVRAGWARGHDGEAAGSADPAPDARLVRAGTGPGWSTVTERPMAIRAMPMSHGPDRDVANLAFLVDIEGVRILHVGDSEVRPAALTGLRLDTLDVDYAVLPAWYRFGERWADAIDRIRPGTVLLAHLPGPDYRGGFVARHGGWSGVEELLDTDPRPTRALRNPGTTVCLRGA